MRQRADFTLGAIQAFCKTNDMTFSHRDENTLAGADRVICRDSSDNAEPRIKHVLTLLAVLL